MSTPAYPKSLAEALVALQSQLPKIEKASEARVQTKQGSYSYRYADLSQLTEIIMPLLARVGLAFTAKPRIAEGGAFVLEYSLIHVSGEREVGQYPLPTGGSPQAIGSAITYGRRYCLCAATGVAPEGDDDGAAAEAEAAANRGSARRATRPRAAASQQARRAQVPAPSAPVGGSPPLPGEEQVTQDQLRALHAALTGAGITAREDCLSYCGEVVGREIASSRDLTRREASRIIDRLRQPSEPHDDDPPLDDPTLDPEWRG